jgi:hypothetical protein
MQKSSQKKAIRRDLKTAANNVSEQLRQVFDTPVVDELRRLSGYNPRQRTATALRLMLVVVEGFLLGQTLSFAALRAIFIRRFGFVRSCPFQKRFKQAEAAKFFRLAVEHAVNAVVCAAGLRLEGALASFADVRVYDGTGQRIPPRGSSELPACSPGKAGTKWVLGYSIKTGLVEHGLVDAETASETPLWHRLVPKLVPGVLYLLDLGFFERRIFAEAQALGAHLLMRLKSSAKVRIIGQRNRNGTVSAVNECSIGYYVKYLPRRRGTTFDLDVRWGEGKEAVLLRLVGFAHRYNAIRWYLTTVPRDQLSARQVITAYRLRWLIELLFRELKQSADLGRSFTADRHAVEALTYGALLAHILVRSLRVQTALSREIPLEQLRPLACLHVARAFAREIVDSLQVAIHETWQRSLLRLQQAFIALARERRPSRSRYRIALEMGAVGA